MESRALHLRTLLRHLFLTSAPRPRPGPPSSPASATPKHALSISSYPQTRTQARLLQRPVPLPTRSTCTDKLATAINPQISQQCRGFHTTNQVNHLMKLTRCRVVDNSPIGKQAMAEGKPPKIIHVYNESGVGKIGDLVLVAIRGEMKKAIIVGVKKEQKTFIPRCDSNNIVLIEENGTPLGTRIHVPIPIILRKLLKEKTVAKGPDYSKLLALATRFI